MKTENPEFLKIYGAYQPVIRRYLARIVGPDEAEDLTQDVFLKALQGLGSFKGQAAVSTWLYRIATNAARDRLRRASFQQTRTAAAIDPGADGGTGGDEADAAMTDEAPSADQQLMWDEMRGRLMELVERLPSHYRTVVVLSELEGLKNGDIAEVLGVSLETVKIRLHRARAKLKEEMDRDREWFRDHRELVGRHRAPARTRS